VYVDEPVAVLVLAAVRFIDDDATVAAAELVAAHRDRPVAGSWLAISHGTAEGDMSAEAYKPPTHRASPLARRSTVIGCLVTDHGGWLLLNHHGDGHGPNCVRSHRTV
jgi:hypothetical protein